VKTWTRRGAKVTLLPANASFSPIELDASDVTVYGKVVTIVRRL
jgi:SOS-response transcriptional repressor LexA